MARYDDEGSHESFYGPRKPGITIINKKAKFICAVCNRKGEGALNQVVHTGRCREEHNRRITRRIAEGRRKKKALAAAEQPVPIAS